MAAPSVALVVGSSGTRWMSAIDVVTNHRKQKEEPMKKLLVCGIALLCVLGCSERRSGPLERAGERTDEIMDNAAKGKPLLHKPGALEKTGESIDESLGLDRDRR